MRLKHIFLSVALFLACSIAKAQVNIQEMYDFNRHHLTTTLEMFKADPWGSTFFFTDIYHPSSLHAPTGYYTEISRSLNFWHNTSLAPLSLHVEWDGGQLANNAWLFGADYLLHNADFSNTFTFSLMYKRISQQKGNVPLQFTFVWNMNNLFSVNGLLFSGFLDIWGEKTTWFENTNPNPPTTSLVLLSEPQLWYNIGQHLSCPNLFVGGEIEIAYNFAGGYHNTFAHNKGLTIAPCLGVKWNF